MAFVQKKKSSRALLPSEGTTSSGDQNPAATAGSPATAKQVMLNTESTSVSASSSSGSPHSDKPESPSFSPSSPLNEIDPNVYLPRGRPNKPVVGGQPKPQPKPK